MPIMNTVISGGGINWTAHRDIAANLGISEATWAIEFDELPDGHYEAYLQSLATMISTDIYTPRTFKLDFVKKDSSEPNKKEIYGSIAIVMEDTTYTSSEYPMRLNDVIYANYSGTSTSQKDLIYIDNLRLQWWSYGRGNTKTIPNAIRATSVKNVDTGVEYPTTIVIGELNEFPSDYSAYKYDYGISTGLMVDMPQFKYWVRSGVNGSPWGLLISGITIYDSSSNGMGNCSGFRVVVEYENGDIFDATLYNSYNNKTYYKVDKNTGVFENTVIKRNSVGSPYIVLNLANNVSGVFSWFCGMIGGGDQTTILQMYDVASANNLIDITCMSVGSTVDINNYGTVGQYTGTTNASYTKGEFYEAKGTITPVAGSINVYNISDPNVTINIDVDTLVPLLVTATGWRTETVVYYLNSGTAFIFYGDGSSLESVYWGVTTTYYDPAILACFTITGWDYNSYLECQINNYVEPHDEVQNGYWEQINVQPTELPSVTGLSDGNYKLRLTMASGVPTLSWVAE